MTQTLAFLRAVNVGGRTFRSADIQRVARELGYTDIETHAASGNLFFSGPDASRAETERNLERAFAADRGFEVPTISFSPAEFAQISADATELATGVELARHYVYLLKDELTPEQRAAVEARADDRGRMVVRGRAAHALLLPGYEDGVVDPLGAAKLLGVATNRNAGVIHRLAQRWARVRHPR